MTPDNMASASDHVISSGTQNAPQTGLYCFSHDLRVQDNPQLNELLCRCDRVMFIYLLNPEWFKTDHRGIRNIGEQRWRFLYESLQALDQCLQRYGHQLHLLAGNPLTLIPALCKQHHIRYIAGSYNSGLNEYRQWQRLTDQLGAEVLLAHQNTLWTSQQLPFSLHQLPKQFTPFRSQVEELAVHDPISLSERLNLCQPVQSPDNTLNFEQLPQPCLYHAHAPFTGGEDAGWQQLHQYLWKSRQIEYYKQTRNELDGWQNSSRLSPWLALGCLSPRQIWADIAQYETELCANESTAWLKFELLWRGVFYWSAHRLGADLYQPGGEKKKNLLTSFYAQRFRSWCEGSTPYPLVNACMRQLNATGFLSNRARQIVASALVNELSVSWQHGAAYFESQLLDYDPGSNYGNWQYIAGVGADPRGGRHFNLQKQQQEYDPEGIFIRKWQGGVSLQRDAVGIDDWPLI